MKSKPSDAAVHSATENLQSLLTQKIVPEEFLRAFSQQELLADDHAAFERALDELRVSGQLSSFQLKKIGSEGVDSLRFGPYVLLDHLGKGGMGEVLLARHVELDRQVALKILPPSLTSSTERRERFRREIRLLAKLDHQGIVKAIDAGHHNDIPYLAMEYLAGGTLQDNIANDGPISWNRLIRWMVSACDALAYAHEQGIIHRDIKPSNLAVDGDKQLKVLDLGLARATQMDPTDSTDSFVTSADQMLGTVDFMPPEQSVSEAEVLPQADVYSLGCTMFTLLSGRPIFPGNSVMAKVVSHRRDPPPSVSELRPEVPPELDQLIQRMVAKSPDERPSSMSAIAERLQEIAEQYRLADSTVPGVIATSDTQANHVPDEDVSSTYRDTLPGGPNSKTQDLGPVTGPQSAIHAAGHASKGSLAYVLAGVLGSITIGLLGVLVYLLLQQQRGPQESVGLTPVDPLNLSHQGADEFVSSDLDSGGRAAVDDFEKSKVAAVLRTVALAGGQISYADESSEAGFKRVKASDLADAIDAETSLAIEFVRQSPTEMLLSEIVQIKNLERLSIQSEVSASLSLKTISRAESLSSLSVDARAFPAADIVWLRKNLGLRSLTMHNVERRHIDLLCTLDQIEALSLPDKKFGAGAVEKLREMTHLESLAMSVGGLDTTSTARLIDSNPNCEYQFSSANRILMAKFLVDVSEGVTSPEGRATAESLLTSDQNWLFAHPSMESYQALNRHHRRLFPHKRISSADDNVEIELIDAFLRSMIDMNELMRKANSLDHGLHLDAAYIYKGLGHLHWRRDQDIANRAFEQGFRCIAAVEEERFFGLLANISESVARTCSEDEQDQWLGTTKSYLEKFNPDADSFPGEAKWALFNIAWRLRIADPDASLRYYRRLGELVAKAPEACIDSHRYAFLHGASLAIGIGRLGVAQEMMELNTPIRDWVRANQSSDRFETLELGRECAIAILTDNLDAFVEATDALAEMGVGDKAEEADFSVAGFLALRGWMKPLEESQWKISSIAGNWSGGDVVPITFQLAQGNFDSGLAANLKIPEQSYLELWFQALKLRVQAGQAPNEQQRLRAADIWNQQCQRSNKHFQQIALVVGFLGATTGEPLTDVTWPPTSGKTFHLHDSNERSTSQPALSAVNPEADVSK